MLLYVIIIFSKSKFYIYLYFSSPENTFNSCLIGENKNITPTSLLRGKIKRKFSEEQTNHNNNNNILAYKANKEDYLSLFDSFDSKSQENNIKAYFDNNNSSIDKTERVDSKVSLYLKNINKLRNIQSNFKSDKNFKTSDTSSSLSSSSDSFELDIEFVSVPYLK
jgi:hypothetical protein